MLGVQGVIGVKSGFTTQAGGCDVLAVMRQSHGKSVLILGAVTGEQGPNVLDEAGLQALNSGQLGRQADRHHPGVPGWHCGGPRVQVAGHTVDAVAQSGSSARVLSWPGVTVGALILESSPP